MREHADMLSDGWTYQEYGRAGMTVAGYTCHAMPCVRHGVTKPARHGMETHGGWAEGADPETARERARRAALQSATQ